MPILTRAVLAAVFLSVPLFSAAYPASSDKQEPVAQVYEVKGGALLKSSRDGKVSLVKKGSLLAAGDVLTLDKDAFIAMYFKNGGRKELRAKLDQSLFKVADLAPETQAYNQGAPLFGATRGSDTSPATFHPCSFYYPRETVILNDPPLIEFTLFNARGGEILLGGASVQITQEGKVVDSRKFDSLEYGTLYSYQSPTLNGQAQYSVELRLDLRKELGNVLTVSFPLYICGASDTASGFQYAPFSDTVYRSFESTSIDHNGNKRAITLIKQLAARGDPLQPAVVIELFIP
ncbi:MAG: hypothetical protein WC695_01120 [Candidatus Omnitrophota bacterium]